MKAKFTYLESCVDSDGESITAMNDAAVDVTYVTMLTRCKGLLEWAAGKGYERRAPGLTLKRDWHVSFHRSVYRGQRCYFLRWSAIEFIWTDRDATPHWIIRVEDSINDYQEIQTGYFDGSQSAAAKHFERNTPWSRYFGNKRYQIIMQSNPIVLQWPGDGGG
jgi:hypothetical protein